MLYAIVHTEGVMTFQELRKECPEKKWLPVMVARPKGDKDAAPTVLTFTSQEVCDRFCKRNLPKNWVTGWVSLDQQIVNEMVAQGWNIQVFHYPHKMHGLPNVEFSVEIVYFPAIDLQPANYRL